MKSFVKLFFLIINFTIWKIFPRKKLVCPKKILIINEGFIGDLICMTPFINELARHYFVGVLIQRSMRDIFEDNPDVSEVIFLDKNRKDYGEYDSVIFISSLNPDILDRLGRDKAVYGFVPQDKITFDHLNFSKILLPDIFERKHKVVQLSKFLIFFKKFKTFNPEKNPLIFNLKKDLIKKISKKFNLPKEYFILSPGSRKIGSKFEAKHTLNKEKFLLISKILTSKAEVFIVGSEKERNLGNFIEKKCKNVRNLCGKTSLKELAVLIHESSLLVGVDSGVIHIAASQKVKIIDLINKRFKKSWGPWLNNSNYRIIYSVNKNLDSISYEKIEKTIKLVLKLK